KDFVTHLIIDGTKCGLKMDSAIELEQIRTIDKRRLREKIGHIPPEVMELVNEKLDISFGRETKEKGGGVLEKLTVIENSLIPVYQSDKGTRLVNMRELHAWLGVGRDFSNWIKDRIEKYGFAENQDFILFANSGENSEGRPRLDYIFKLEPAKEIAMVENNEKGKEIRRYFIKIEERYKQIAAPSGYIPQSQIQILQQAISILAEQERALAETKAIALDAKSGLEQAREVINNIKDSMANLPIDQWRKWVNSSMALIVKKRQELGYDLGNDPYEFVKAESYKLLDEQGFDVYLRVKNMKARLLHEGATKARMDEVKPLSIIESDSRMRKIYDSIVKELRIKYLA
ncbi:MAG: antA/AntB antirepressor family protein, partial [Phycisphaerae bacterium]